MHADGKGPLNPPRRNLISSALVAVTALVIVCGNTARGLKKLRLKIAAGPAPVALAEFIRQTRLQVLFEYDAVHQVITHEIDGEFEPEEALRLMFEGSGLSCEFINDRTVAIRPKVPPARR